jgi:uncharacterized protein YuzE
VPSQAEVDAASVRIDYDHPTDTLWVSLVGEPRPAYNVYVDDDAMYRVDPHTGEVVGLEIERFLERALGFRTEPR